MRLNTFSISLLIIFLFPATSFAQNRYVSANGDNTNNGLSWSTSFETIQSAADVIQAGDTVWVENGEYAGFDLRGLDGTASNPIVFIAFGSEVKITSPGPVRQDGINIEGVDYVELNGFQVYNMVNGGNGIRVVLSNGCIIRHCYCEGNDERGIFTAFTDDILIEYNTCTNAVDEHGIYVSNSSDRPIVRYNTCYGNNKIGIHMNGDLSAGGDGIISDAKIYGNVLYENNQAAGINCDGLENPWIYNNLIFNNHTAQGIALFQQDGAIPTSGAKIFNNTIIVPSDGRWGILVKEDCQVNTEIYNNIIINNHAWRGCITIEAAESFTSDFNIFQDKLSDSGDGSTINFTDWQALGFDANSQLVSNSVDLFEDEANTDFELAIGSIAIDNGTNLVDNIVSTDLLGIDRPQGVGFDIGCYEQDMATSAHDVFLNIKEISIHPNPTTDVFKITGLVGAYWIQITDINGQIIDVLYNQDVHSIEIDISTLSAGLYFIIIQHPELGNLSVQKILKS